jgi:predicted PurR-regulated permease PerM
MDDNELYYFIATSIASVFGFILAFILNRFVNKLDVRMDQFDRMFASIQQEISELKETNAVQNNRLTHLENTVYKLNNKK